MRNWLRRWLEIDEYDVNEAIGRLTQTISFQSARLEDLYTETIGLQRRVERYDLELNAIRQNFASLKSPVKQQLLQLKSGLDTLTKFANELQREIEK